MSFAEVRADTTGQTYLYLGGRQFQQIEKADGVIWAGAINAVTTDADIAAFNQAFDLVTQANPIYVKALKEIASAGTALGGATCAKIADQALKDGGQ